MPPCVIRYWEVSNAKSFPSRSLLSSGRVPIIFTHFLTSIIRVIRQYYLLRALLCPQTEYMRGPKDM